MIIFTSVTSVPTAFRFAGGDQFQIGSENT
jgi:hypothetical protein